MYESDLYYFMRMITSLDMVDAVQVLSILLQIQVVSVVESYNL